MLLREKKLPMYIRFMREKAVPAKAVRLWYSWKSKRKWCSDYYTLSWCFHAMKGGESHSRNGHLEMDFGWNEIFNVRPPAHFIQLTLAMSFPTRNFTAFSFFRCLIQTSIQYLQQKHTWCDICIYKSTLFKPDVWLLTDVTCCALQIILWLSLFNSNTRCSRRTSRIQSSPSTHF